VQQGAEADEAAYFLPFSAGAGGFGLGAYTAELRFDRYLFLEIDEYAADVFKKRFPESELLGDARRINYEKLPKREWLAAGWFHGYPRSAAGRWKGAENKRSLRSGCA
jgi:site-specific DNA-cytosine methylase